MDEELETTLNSLLHAKAYNFSVKKEQLAIVASVLKKMDVFAVLPTGFGKSLCYVLPVLYWNHKNPAMKNTVLVISPLKALIAEQVQTLQEHQIDAFGIYEGTKETDLASIKSGQASILIASPEALQQKHWKKVIADVYAKLIRLITYDEAHCISEWGLNFRPAYRRLTHLQSIVDAPVLTLTGTCTKEIKTDIINTLGMKDVHVFAPLPDRPNITLAVIKASDKPEQELQWVVDGLKSRGRDNAKMIIYVLSITVCERLYISFHSLLSNYAYDGERVAANRMVEMYHSATDAKSKERVLDSFTRVGGTIRILVATVAVGMGINIPDVRVVVIWGLPNSMLQLWQQAGRSGRDGQQALAVCYAYQRSISAPCDACRDKRQRQCSCAPRKHMQELVSTPLCQRVHCLSPFSLSTESQDSLKELRHRQDCDKDCDTNCTCQRCRCCVNCFKSCSCVNAMSLDKVIQNYMTS